MIAFRPQVLLGVCVALALLSPLEAQNPSAAQATAPSAIPEDGIPDIVTGMASGGSHVRILSGADGAPLMDGAPFGGFTGGVRVATGDVDGDGRGDVIVAQGAGGSLVRVFNTDTVEIAAGPPFGRAFTGGVFVAAGDVNGDGADDVITATGMGGLVRVYSVAGGVRLLREGFPYGTLFTGGIRVAAGDVDGDGIADIITAPAAGAARVKVFRGSDSSILAEGAPYGEGFTGGIHVAAGDVNGDGFADVITSPSAGSMHVRVFTGPAATPALAFHAAPLTYGLSVAAADLTGDGKAEIIGGVGPGGPPVVGIFDGTTGARLSLIDAEPATFTGGIFVAALSTRGSVRFTSPATATFTAGTAGSFTITTSASPAVTAIAITGTLPAGITFADNHDGTATLTGTPALDAVGTHTVTLTATNGAGAAATQTVTLEVICPAITINPTTVPPGTAGEVYGPVTFTQTGAGSAATWSLDSGTLPAGLTLSSAGVLSGTPTATGAFPFSIRATSAGSCGGTQALTLQIDCPTITVSPSTLAPAAVGAVYGPVTFTQTGGIGAVTFAITAGALPPGITLSASGVLSGTPTDAGTFTITVTTTDANGCTGTVTAALQVNVQANAENDTYPHAVVGNVGINSSLVGYSVLTNDAVGASPQITAFDVATAAGGTVAMQTAGASAGQFTYNPPAGYEGADSFTYTVTAGGASDTATVNLNVTGMIWFVNGAAGGSGDGRLSSPFNTLAAFAAINDGVGNHPAPGDNVFLYQISTPYAGGVTLLNGQRLIGQDARATLDAIAGIAPGPGSQPLPVMIPGDATTVTVTGPGPSVVTLGQNNTVRGLQISSGAVPTPTTTAMAGNPIGTLTVADVTITGSGRAVDIAFGTLAATFDAITSTGHGVDAIVVAETTGSFVVTGDGTTAGSGGTIQAVNRGVVLSNATGVDLRHMNIEGCSQRCIHGLGINGLSMTGTRVASAAGDVVEISRLTGTSVWTGVTIEDAGARNVIIVNDSGTATLMITNSDIRQNDLASGASGLQVELSDTASMTMAVTNSRFSQHRTHDVNVIATSTGTVNVTLTGNTLSGGHAARLGGSSSVLLNGSGGFGGMLRYNVSENLIQGAVGSAIALVLDASSTADARFSGQVVDNVIGSAGTTQSCSTQAHGLLVEARGLGAHTALVEGNLIRECQDLGVRVLAGEGNSTIHLTMRNNDVQHVTSPLSAEALHAEAGVVTGDTVTACFDIGASGANTLQPGPNATIPNEAFRVRQRFNSTVRLPGYTGAPGDAGQVATFISGQNGGAPGSASHNSPPAPGFIGGAACNAPTLPSVP